MEKPKEQPTIWEVSESLWEIISGLLDMFYPRSKKGPDRVDLRRVLNGIIFRMRSGCQWNQIPVKFGDDSTIHRHFQKWCEFGIIDRIMASIIEQCDELGGVNWEWQSADGALRKARMGGDLIGPNPTDRGKKGTKHSILVESDGGPLSIAIAGANVHDTKLLAATLDAIVVERPEPSSEAPQNLCLDKGYDNPTGHSTAESHGYVKHVRRIGEEKLDPNREKTVPARRWVVERTLAWISKCRALLIRYDKKSTNYLGLLKLACALIWFRRLERLQIAT